MNHKMKTTGNILVIPDLHCPFEHQKALRFVSDLKYEYKCKRIIQIGDLVDMYSFSRYAKSPDAIGTRKEIKLARARLTEWIGEFPSLEITIGNHEMRIQKRLCEIGIPPDTIIKTVNELYELPKSWVWNTHISAHGVTYLHGVLFGKYAHIRSAEAYRCSIVMGHSHCSLGVDYLGGINDRIFGANAGCLIDDKKIAFQYASEMAKRPVLGAIIMLNGKTPICIPMD